MGNVNILDTNKTLSRLQPRYGYITEEHLNFNYTKKIKTPTKFILEVGLNTSKNLICNETTIYSTGVIWNNLHAKISCNNVYNSHHITIIADNCWDYIYVQPAVSKLHDPAIKHKLQRMYFSTAKPNTGGYA